MIQINDPALSPTIMFYSVSAYPVFERVGFDRSKEIVTQADQVLLENPLSRNKKGEFDKFDIDEFGSVSVVFCAALVSAFLVWTQREAGIDYLPDSPFLSAANDGYNLYRRK
jgi:hypothetical protein